MTTKNNVKTVLFASLIAAMILPFSGMNFAVAEKQTTDPIRKKLLEYTEQQPTISQKGKKSTPQLALDVYDLQNRITKGIEKGNDSEITQKQFERLVKMQAELKSRFSGAEDMTHLSKEVKSPEIAMSTQALDNKWATIGTHAVCGFVTKTSTTGGFVLSHLSGVWMTGGISYPSELDKNTWPFCGGSSNIYEFDDAIETFYPVTTPNQGCYHTWNTNTGTLSEYCPYIHNGDVVLVWTDGIYNVPLNPTKSTNFSSTMIGYMAVDFGGN